MGTASGAEPLGRSRFLRAILDVYGYWPYIPNVPFFLEKRMDARARGGNAPRAARKKANRLEARLTDEQKALLQHAAELRGQTLSEFVIRAGEEAATRVLDRAGVIVLAARDSAAFVEAVLHPPEPGQRLRAAARRYRAGGTRRA